jgi:hypothetical protein
MVAPELQNWMFAMKSLEETVMEGDRSIFSFVYGERWASLPMKRGGNIPIRVVVK